MPMQYQQGDMVKHILSAEARDGLREQVQKVNPQLRPIAVLLISTIVLFIVSMTVIFWPVGMRWRSKRK